MHDVGTWLDRLPTIVFLTQAIEHPQQKPYGKVAIILEMPNEIATSDAVSEMQVIMPHKKMIAEGTGFTTRAGTVLRKPNRKISLARERIASEMINEVI